MNFLQNLRNFLSCGCGPKIAPEPAVKINLEALKCRKIEGEEASIENPKIGLLDMPKDVMDMIFGYVDFREICSLRKTCYNIRSHLVSTAPDPKLTHISIHASKLKMLLILNQEIEISYEYHMLGCLITKDGVQKKVLKWNMMDCFLGDLQYFVRAQKSKLEHVQVDWKEYQSRDRSIESIFEAIEEALKSRKFSLKVQKLTVSARDQGQILQVLPYLDANFLKDLVIIASVDQNQNNESFLEIDEIVELDQWKRLETVDIEHCLKTNPYMHFTHFQLVKVFMESWTGFEPLYDNFDNPLFMKIEIKAQSLMPREHLINRFVHRPPEPREMEDHVFYFMSTTSIHLFIFDYETSTFTFMRPEFHELGLDGWEPRD